jgi:hypothetical protein
MSVSHDLRGYLGDKGEPVIPEALADSRFIPGPFTVRALVSADVVALHGDCPGSDCASEGKEAAMTMTWQTSTGDRSGPSNAAASLASARERANLEDSAEAGGQGSEPSNDAGVLLNESRLSTSWASIDSGVQRVDREPFGVAFETPRCVGDANSSSDALVSAASTPPHRTTAAEGAAEGPSERAAIPLTDPSGSCMVPIGDPAAVGSAFRESPTAQNYRIGMVSVDELDCEAIIRRLSTGGTVQMVWLKLDGKTIAQVAGFVRRIPSLSIPKDQPRPWPEERDAAVLEQVLALWRAAGLDSNPEEA